jgi:lysostaphin
VGQGERIADIGSTGVTTGPHLHFEIQVNGVARDPMPYLGRNR